MNREELKVWLRYAFDAGVAYEGWYPEDEEIEDILREWEKETK